MQRERIRVNSFLHELCVLHTSTRCRLVYSFQRSSGRCNSCVASRYSRIDADSVAPASWTLKPSHTLIHLFKLARWAWRRLVVRLLPHEVVVDGSTASKVAPSRRFLLQVATIRSPTRVQSHLRHMVHLASFSLLLSPRTLILVGILEDCRIIWHATSEGLHP